MVRLSERTLQGMRRAYEGTLDGFAFLYREQKTETATGRTSTFSRLTDEHDQIIDRIELRIDPLVIDETFKAQLIEKGNEAYLSLPTSLPLLVDGDQVRILESECSDVETQIYEVKAAAQEHSGVALDRKYRAVRIA